MIKWWQRETIPIRLPFWSKRHTVFSGHFALRFQDAIYKQYYSWCFLPPMGPMNEKYAQVKLNQVPMVRVWACLKKSLVNHHLQAVLVLKIRSGATKKNDGFSVFKPIGSYRIHVRYIYQENIITIHGSFGGVNSWLKFRPLNSWISSFTEPKALGIGQQGIFPERPGVYGARNAKPKKQRLAKLQGFSPCYFLLVVYFIMICNEWLEIL